MLHGSHDQVEVLDLVVPQQVVVCEHDSGFIGARGITPPKGFAGDGSCNEKEQTPLKKLKYNHANKLRVRCFPLFMHSVHKIKILP